MLTTQQQRAVAPCELQSELYQQEFPVPAAWRQPAQFQLSEQQGELALPAILDTPQHPPKHHTNWPSHHRHCRPRSRAATLGSMLLLPADDSCCSTCSLSVRMNATPALMSALISGFVKESAQAELYSKVS